MNKKLLALAIGLVMVTAAAAAVLFLFPYQPDQPPQAESTNATEKGMQEVADANNKFAFDLYSRMEKSESGNIFYSPYSISSALAMTYEGARGTTAEEIKTVFHFPESNVLRPNFAAIYNEINKKDKPYKLSTGNALWAQQNYPFLQDYLNTVEKYYGRKAANLDFIGETEKSRQTINTFIEKQTNDKIKDLIPQGMLDPSTRLVLTNAIYFKGTWEWEFDKSKTREQDFKISPTNTVKAQMMNMEPDKARFKYAETEDLQIIELPYKGGELSMLILLPKDPENTGTITAEKLKEYKDQMKETKLDYISIPQFEFHTKYFMKDTLSEMGMPTAFSDRADFSGMTGKRNLLISFVIHQAFVKVDEEGTEAAAATAVGMRTTSFTPKTIFNADHPFTFIIQENKTGNILFMGKVTNPNE